MTAASATRQIGPVAQVVAGPLLVALGYLNYRYLPWLYESPRHKRFAAHWLNRVAGTIFLVLAGVACTIIGIVRLTS